MAKILVVEDSSFQRKAILKTLEKMHIEYDWAENGERGHDLAVKNSYDLILTDLLMPKLDGTEMIKQLRDEKCLTPILALTANIQRPVVEELKLLGVIDIIHKPFDEDAFIETINNALSKVTR